MIGLLVLVGRLGAPASLIPELYGPARVHVPKAPGLGLLLEEPFFHGYNRKLEDARARPGGGQGEDREFVEYSAFKGQMDEFKQVSLRVRSRCRGRETDKACRRLSSTIGSCRRRKRRQSESASPRRFLLALADPLDARFAKWLNYLGAPCSSLCSRSKRRLTNGDTDVFQGPDFEYLNPRGVIVSTAPRLSHTPADVSRCTADGRHPQGTPFSFPSSSPSL